MFAVQAPEIPLQPTCQKCRRPVDVMKAQITGKSAGVWRCNGCNTKGTQLARIFGTWPPRSFASLPADGQALFWQGLDGLMGGAALEKHVIDAITTKRCEIEQATTGG